MDNDVRGQQAELRLLARIEASQGIPDEMGRITTQLAAVEEYNADTIGTPEPEDDMIAPDPPEGWEPDDEPGTIYEDVKGALCPHCGASEVRNIYTRHGTGNMFHARNCPAYTEENNRAAWHAPFDDRDHLRALHRCGVEMYHAVKARHNRADTPADIQQDREATLRHLNRVLTELEDAIQKASKP